MLADEILTVPGDRNRTGIVRLQLVKAATLTPDTVIVDPPVAAVTIPLHPLMTSLVVRTMGDGSVNVYPIPDVVVLLLLVINTLKFALVVTMAAEKAASMVVDC